MSDPDPQSTTDEFDRLLVENFPDNADVAAFLMKRAMVRKILDSCPVPDPNPLPFST